ncbi:MAG: DUF1385 domain-containing protein [Lachnospiraceae bacterium]|nr:DUF1385 domain-containing protein [Lachnospiraceae bacterium]
MKSSEIGGQAVLEGVMMKNKNRYAVAVRKPDNQIEIKTGDCRSIGERNVFFRLPVIRGVVTFAESLVLGIRTLTYSSEFFEDGEEEGKNVSKTKETLLDAGVVVLSVFMAVVVFILLPLLISSLLGHLLRSETLKLLFEGVLRIVMFVAYVVLIARVEDIKRVFMYHGAEHKCINCVESGEELTVANVRRQTRSHKRCGTSFLLVVMLVSFVLFMFIRVRTAWLRYVLRIVLIPLIAGISYEFIRLAGRSNNRIVALLSRPGLLLQKLTTKEPDDSMIEVAIASVEAVFDWRAFQDKEGIARKRLTGKQNKAVPERGGKRQESAAAVEEELSSLDRLFDAPSKSEEELAAAIEKQIGLKNKIYSGKVSSASAMKAPAGEEEEDDILRALDRFFIYEEKTADARGNKKDEG